MGFSLTYVNTIPTLPNIKTAFSLFFSFFFPQHKFQCHLKTFLQHTYKSKCIINFSHALLSWTHTTLPWLSSHLLYVDLKSPFSTMFTLVSSMAAPYSLSVEYISHFPYTCKLPGHPKPHLHLHLQPWFHAYRFSWNFLNFLKSTMYKYAYAQHTTDHSLRSHTFVPYHQSIL